MGKQINFVIQKKARHQMKVDDIRAMYTRIQERDDNISLDDIEDDFLAEMEELDPEAAKFMRESIARAGQAEVCRYREAGVEIPGTEFETRRDRKAMEKEYELDRKIQRRMHDLRND